MHVTSRPHAGDEEEPVPRRPILSQPKLIAEGRPEEVQTVLGWRLDTRRLEIALPKDKYVAWLGDIKKIRGISGCTHAELETLVGRLNHTAYILPNARHFLNRIRAGLHRRPNGGVKGRGLKMGAEAMEDLALWEDFLSDAHAGVSMNLLVTRTPNKVCWSDACPYGSGGLRHLSAAGRNTLLDNASASNRRIIFDGRQESNETYDRTWRRWEGFCEHAGYNSDPYLALLSVDEQQLVIRAFLNFYRVANWDPNGRPDGTRKVPVVASTLRKTTSNLAAAFRRNIGQSPLHLPGSSNLRPFVRMWLKACDNGDPPKKQQRAVTPQLLRSMYDQSGCNSEAGHDSEAAIVAEIAIVAYFFAMRSCEITVTPAPGRTKITRLRGVTFRDHGNREMDQKTGDLAEARRVTVTFEDQKNGLKNDRRTHEKTGDPVMCPVLRLASLVNRVLRMVPAAGPDTPLSATRLGRALESIVRDTQEKPTIRVHTGRRKGKFGYTAADIGTRSIRSGAAMGLFLMNHPVAKIMILGRWSSDAFLDYIRPQVLEWTNQMSSDMIRNNSFFDASDDRRASKDDPRTRRLKPVTIADGGKKMASKLHLHH
ncbi:hypothetical protein MHU86_16410 [Fragilaria crotonensis]|nr:hypothetical protein MHU86_16410 [Fragilaria crotonensis]